MNKVILSLLTALACAVSPAAMAVTNSTATNATATITADNHYMLFTGDASGNDLSLVATNAPNERDVNGYYEWMVPESFSFTANAGDYLYVLAWDTGGPQGWIGNFNTPDGALTSNKTDWVFSLIDTPNPGDGNNLPSIASVQADIQDASWTAPAADVANDDSSIWVQVNGPMNGMGDARWVWNDTLDSDSNSDGKLVLFRSLASVAAVPEPSAWMMMLSGVLCLGCIARRRMR